MGELARGGSVINAVRLVTSEKSIPNPIIK